MNHTFFPEKRPRWLWLIIECFTAVLIGCLSIAAHWGQIIQENMFFATSAWFLGWWGYSLTNKIAAPSAQPSVVISIDRNKLTPEQEADIDEAMETMLAVAKESDAIK